MHPTQASQTHFAQQRYLFDLATFLFQAESLSKTEITKKQQIQ